MLWCCLCDLWKSCLLGRLVIFHNLLTNVVYLMHLNYTAVEISRCNYVCFFVVIFSHAALLLSMQTLLFLLLLISIVSPTSTSVFTSRVWTELFLRGLLLSLLALLKSGLKAHWPELYFHVFTSRPHVNYLTQFHKNSCPHEHTQSVVCLFDYPPALAKDAGDEWGILDKPRCNVGKACERKDNHHSQCGCWNIVQGPRNLTVASSIGCGVHSLGWISSFLASSHNRALFCFL